MSIFIRSEKPQFTIDKYLIMSDKKIKSALISVYRKDGLEDVVKKLEELGISIYSTGGTYDYITSLGIEAVAVESITSYPSILGGRVKTLHPKIFGGILARRDNQSDTEQIRQYQIPETDMVIVDLYPFSETVRGGASEQEIIEKIDIGGISLIRAGAKNYNDVLTIGDSSLYGDLLSLLKEKSGFTSLSDRKRFATEAFRVSSGYDADIFNYFNREGVSGALRLSIDNSRSLRYGENPHQRALYYGEPGDLFTQLHGKEISYNNLLDIEAALSFIAGVKEPAFAIIKHNNACGFAVAPELPKAWERALAGDPISAFGGVISASRTIDIETAKLINSLFFEVIAAPGYEKEALEILKSKKNRIILNIDHYPNSTEHFRTVLDGILWQERDSIEAGEGEPIVVTTRKPEKREMNDILLANRIVMNTKSNAIVLVKDLMLIGSGTGQTSRVDAVRQAIAKAESGGLDTRGAVMASDAFFPFADSVLLAAEAGVTAVIQPGGSVRDNESIEACNRNNMAMVVTGVRHFKH